ncbi:ABC transporter ATP-binding protein [Bradyrhizobium liaoningense]
MLAVEDLDVSVAGAPVLRGVTLAVRPGEMVCLVGRNGAGKTTLMKSLMGQHRPTGGRILWQGKSIVGSAPHEIARLGIGFSPEESEVFASLSVEQNIAFPTWVRRSAKPAAERIDLAYLVFPKLKECLHRGGSELSGGERKMVSIARALTLDPDMLLLDEPFEGLSPAIIPTIAAGIASIRDAGRAILMAESNVQHIPEYVSRVNVIERGEIVFDGQVAEARRDPSVRQIVSGLS